MIDRDSVGGACLSAAFHVRHQLTNGRMHWSHPMRACTALAMSPNSRSCHRHGDD